MQRILHLMKSLAAFFKIRNQQKEFGMNREVFLSPAVRTENSSMQKQTAHTNALVYSRTIQQIYHDIKYSK